ncbi:MAG TPA: TIGR04282 family arsenosugar biosynthesis glycosyltransferase, partial [Candidatus Eisenbacteria bacterium]|nr:TIGR04282 family arsenosugar biosynthesis glycosyltransferase [Candidatus Eisenbacteria bacterium]
PEEAAEVARASLEDTLRRFPSRVEAAWTLFLDGETDRALQVNAAAANVRVLPQGSGDLGERLARAFARLRDEGSERVVAVGSDSPTLDPALIGGGIAALGHADVVLGPAEDGGYYLIGVSATVDVVALFRAIPWSTPSVARVTAERAVALGLTVVRLPEWYDLDDAAALRRAATDPALAECPALSRTLAALGTRVLTSPA